MTRLVGRSFAFLAAIGLVGALPAGAAGTRSADLVPLMAANVGSVPYSVGAENTWRCVAVTDEVIKLNDEHVQVDAAGRVVLSPQGQPYRCRAPAGEYTVGRGGGFPFEILLGILGTAGLVFALAGSGGSDSDG